MSDVIERRRIEAATTGGKPEVTTIQRTLTTQFSKRSGTDKIIKGA